MSLIDIQRKARRLGNLRMGTKNAEGYPVKLTTWRLTSPAQGLIAQAAQRWGGEVVPWENQYEVVTETAELPVFVPPQDPENLSWYELWSAGGRQRRCDGAVMSDGAQCVCGPDPQRRQCKPRTQMTLMLPDLDDIGVWALSSIGKTAAEELAFALDRIMEHFQQTGEIVPATLGMVQREARVSGEKPHQFVVPELRIERPMREMALSANQSLAAGSPASPALPAARPPEVPLPVPSSPGDGQEEAVEAPEAESLAAPSPVPRGDIDPEALEAVFAHLAANKNPTVGNIADIEERTRTLYRLMAAAGLWADSALHKGLANFLADKKMEPKRPGEVHWSDLSRKSTMQHFAVKSFEAAETKVSS